LPLTISSPIKSIKFNTTKNAHGVLGIILLHDKHDDDGAAKGGLGRANSFFMLCHPDNRNPQSIHTIKYA